MHANENLQSGPTTEGQRGNKPRQGTTSGTWKGNSLLDWSSLVSASTI